MRILCNFYNGEIKEYIGYTDNEKMLDLLRSAQGLLIPRNCSADFNDNYSPIDIDEYEVGEEDLVQDFYHSLSEEELRSGTIYVYEVGYTLWYDRGITEDRIFTFHCVHSNNRKEVEESFTERIKEQKRYKELMDRYGDVEIGFNIKSWKLENLDEELGWVFK